jgi:hypothetical protein
MTDQSRYHFSESLETFFVCADRHDNVNGSANAAEKEESAQYI